MGANSFSPLCKRGENSSRGRRFNITNLNKEAIIRHINLFLQQAPNNAAGIVLQIAIDQSKGCLLHTEISGHHTIIDILGEQSTKRAYAHARDGIISEYEEIPGVSNFENWHEACQKLTKRCNNYYHLLRESLGDMKWSIEGFWEPEEEQVTILQLRPTPNDQPIPMNKNVSTTDGQCQTFFIWGDYTLGPIKLKTDLQNDLFVLIRTHPLNEKMEEKIIKYLGKNTKCILIDPFRGFALSHEKWFLPIHHLRNNFYYIHLPHHILATYKHKDVYRYSSGNKGYLCSKQAYYSIRSVL